MRSVFYFLFILSLVTSYLSIFFNIFFVCVLFVLDNNNTFIIFMFLH